MLFSISSSSLMSRCDLTVSVVYVVEVSSYLYYDGSFNNMISRILVNFILVQFCSDCFRQSECLCSDRLRFSECLCPVVVLSASLETLSGPRWTHTSTLATTDQHRQPSQQTGQTSIQSTAYLEPSL